MKKCIICKKILKKDILTIPTDDYKNVNVHLKCVLKNLKYNKELNYFYINCKSKEKFNVGLTEED